LDAESVDSAISIDDARASTAENEELVCVSSVEGVPNVSGSGKLDIGDATFLNAAPDGDQSAVVNGELKGDSAIRPNSAGRKRKITDEEDNNVYNYIIYIFLLTKSNIYK
jgi:hypothetical protein